MRPVEGQADRPRLDMRSPHERGLAGWHVSDVDVCALWRRVFDAGVPGGDAPKGGTAETSALASPARGVSQRTPSEAGRPQARVEAATGALDAERSAGPPSVGDGSRPLAASPSGAQRSLGTAAERERDAPPSDARAVVPEAARPESGTAPAATARTAPPPAASIAAAGPVADGAPAAAGASDAAAHGGASLLSGAASGTAHTAEAAGAPPTACAPDARPSERDGRAAREAVHVRCQADGSVAVVVRDAALPPALAVRWSLETAYALRGEHAALQRVTLNGRTVYLRGATQSEPPAAAAGLCFAC